YAQAVDHSQRDAETLDPLARKLCHALLTTKTVALPRINAALTSRPHGRHMRSVSCRPANHAVPAPCEIAALPGEPARQGARWPAAACLVTAPAASPVDVQEG